MLVIACFSLSAILVSAALCAEDFPKNLKSATDIALQISTLTAALDYRNLDDPKVRNIQFRGRLYILTVTKTIKDDDSIINFYPTDLKL